MPGQLMQIKATPSAKVLMSLAVAIAWVCSWFVVRLYTGNTLAEYLNIDNRMEIAQRAVSWAPGNPLTHWSLGKFIQTQLPPEQIPAAVVEYEKAVSLAPNDYRFWMELGDALEQAGEFDKAVKALREAVRLAPSYAYPRWLLGNLLVRTDRYEEGFAELRTASEADNQFQGQLFNLAWQLNKDDFDALKRSIGETPEVRANFSQYLVERSRFDEGLRLWNTLTETEKRANRNAADAIIHTLIISKQYHQAVQVWSDVAPGLSYRANAGHIIDGGFEENVVHGSSAVFGWQVQSMSQVQTGIDANVGHNSNRSLRMSFQVRTHLDPLEISQLVPIEPDKQYDFECYFKTERLESAATPVVVVSDATYNTNLAASESAPPGNNDWQRVALSFKTGAKTEAVKVSIYRSSCVDSPICPIFGVIWYDDFDLKPRK